MQTILVTGGAGFIGSHVVVELVAAGYRPVIIDNFSNSERESLDRIESLIGQKLTSYEQNIDDTEALKRVFEAEKPVGVIHFAAFKAVGESVADPLKYYANNVGSFVTLVRAATDRNVNAFIFSSTAAVYGQPATEQVTEATPCHPESPYGTSKYMDELILRDSCAATPDLRGIALRYFNVVGAHESGKIGELPIGKPQNLLPIIVQSVTGQIPPLTIYGTDYDTPDGTCLRDYVHVVDLAKAHVAALQKALAATQGSYDVYNISTGTPTSVLEMIKTFERVNGVTVPYSLGPRRAGDPAAYYAIATKAQQELGWQATKTVNDAVADAWRWQQRLSASAIST